MEEIICQALHFCYNKKLTLSQRFYYQRHIENPVNHYGDLGKQENLNITQIVSVDAKNSNSQNRNSQGQSGKG